MNVNHCKQKISHDISLKLDAFMKPIALFFFFIFHHVNKKSAFLQLYRMEIVHIFSHFISYFNLRCAAHHNFTDKMRKKSTVSTRHTMSNFLRNHYIDAIFFFYIYFEVFIKCVEFDLKDRLSSKC